MEFSCLQEYGGLNRIAPDGTIGENKLMDELPPNEDSYKMMVENAGEMVLVTQDGSLKFVNSRVTTFLGYTPEESIGKPIADYIHPEDRKPAMDRHMKLLTGEDLPSVNTLRVIGRDGSIKWVETNTVRIQWRGKPAALTFMSDITERKAAQEKILEERDYFEKVINGLPATFYMFDTDGNMVRWNQRFEKISGLTPEDIVRMKAIEHIPDAYKDETLKAIKDVFASGESSIEAPILTKDGEEIPFFFTAVRVNIDGESYLVGTGIDITVRKQTEEALRQSEEKYRILVENSPLAVSLIGKNGRHKYLNFKFSDIFGYSIEDIPTGKDWLRKAFPDEDDRKRVVSAYLEDQNRYGNGESRSRTYRMTCKDGSEKSIRFRLVTMETGDQLNIYEDITETECLEEQLRQAQKMEAIGNLAGGVAHDFSNLLQAIIGNTQILKMNREEQDADLDKLRDIEEVAGNASELIQQLLAFSRRVESKMRPMDLNYEVRQVEKLLKRTIPKMIGIELHLQDELNVINADPVQVEQVMMNLGVNAKDAMPEGGRLIIETENAALDDAYCKSHLGAVPGEYVLLTLSDTGHGMDREILNHIFEPFYTTKKTGQGTGLGLAMVYGIIKSHGGYIMCYSEPEAGTTFKIYFPVNEAGSVVYDSKSSKKKSFPEGSETLLLVDDELILRDLGQEILERYGYKVFVADTGEQAIEIFKKNKEAISLVLLDLIMPGMGGQKCLEELLKIDPSQKVIIASGYSINGPTKEAFESGASGFIKKPFEIGTMLSAIRKVLD